MSEDFLPATLSSRYLGEAVSSLLTCITPKEHIKTRPGPGGRILKYVSTGYVVNTLNALFGRLWDWEVIQTDVFKTEVNVLGKLTCHLTYDGEWLLINKMAWGSQPIRENVELGDMKKAASSDALKKAASLLGIAADLYGEREERDELEEVSKEGTR